MFCAKQCSVPPLSACCVYQCLRRDRGYCTVSFLLFGCVTAVHCTVALLPCACFIPGRPRKPGGGYLWETGEWALDISVMDAANTTHPHKALIFERFGWLRFSTRLPKIPHAMVSALCLDCSALYINVSQVATVSLLVLASVCVSWYHSLVSMSVRPTHFDPDPVSLPLCGR